jgi:hypothetical protein
LMPLAKELRHVGVNVSFDYSRRNDMEDCFRLILYGLG